jgi:hypothetical protein
METPATQAAGVAGLVGTVFGDGKPMLPDDVVVGATAPEYALGVFFDERKVTIWFPEELLEFLDHDAGATITLQGVPKKWVRQASGEWLELDTPRGESLWRRMTARFRRDG